MTITMSKTMIVPCYLFLSCWWLTVASFIKVSVVVAFSDHYNLGLRIIRTGQQRKKQNHNNNNNNAFWLKTSSTTRTTQNHHHYRYQSLYLKKSTNTNYNYNTDDDDDDAYFDVSKRQFLKSMATTTTASAIAFGAFDWSFLPANAAAAASQVRAPLELLRPATRIRLYIDKAIEICQQQQQQQQGEGEDVVVVLQTLQQYFDKEPKTFMTPEEETLSRRYLEIKTGKAWQQARLKERELRGAELGIDYTTPYDKFNTAIQQWGDNRQFQILRSRQRHLEEQNSIRKALNAYTNNLIFGDGYQLNVSGAEKKALVRQDALPDVNAVVVSDLDLRDLYRNQILQNIDDAKAELTYQLRIISSANNNNEEEVDINEIQTCLLAAQESCNKWFSFIPKDDVEEALKEVQLEMAQK